ncbi:unnamed protein product [Amoebophrya sp. A25]|nr:unnamed protein product [Amoebophrya sp. A25]|eukprot:GSA25T00001134001.1
MTSSSTPVNAAQNVPTNNDGSWHYEIFPQFSSIGDLEERKQGRTTHLRVWPGSRYLLDWMQKDKVFTQSPGQILLEEDSDCPRVLQTPRTSSTSRTACTATRSARRKDASCNDALEEASPRDKALPDFEASDNPGQEHDYDAHIWRVLELGAGTGWMGLTLAANLGPNRVHVTLTDLLHALPALRANVRESKLSNVSCEACDWQDFMPSFDSCDSEKTTRATRRPTEYDLVIGTELAWQIVGAKALPWVLKAHRSAGARVLYGHQPAYSKVAHATFLATCEEAEILLRDRTIKQPVSSTENREAGAAPSLEDRELSSGRVLEQTKEEDSDEEAPYLHTLLNDPEEEDKNSARSVRTTQGFTIYEINLL